MERDYAERRGNILRDLDGLRVEVDPEKKIGYLILDRPPLNIVSFKGRAQIRAIIEAFDEDVQIVLADCERLYNDFNVLPEECQLIIANMMFNMGRPRLSKFKGMKAGVDSQDWQKAADEMVDSGWYRQVTNRAQRLVDRMRTVGIV